MRAALAVKDYSRIIKFLLDNPIQVLGKLGTKKFVSSNKKPTAKDYLQAALNTDEIDENTKKSIRKVLDVYPYVEKQVKQISEPSDKNIKNIESQLRKAKNFGQTKQVVKKCSSDPKFQDDSDLKSGLGLAWHIIDDGSHHPERKNVFFKILKSIAAGGVAGAVYGTTGGTTASERRGTKGYSKVGAQAGGVGGATIGSVEAIGEGLWQWIYS